MEILISCRFLAQKYVKFGIKTNNFFHLLHHIYHYAQSAVCFSRSVLDQIKKRQIARCVTYQNLHDYLAKSFHDCLFKHYTSPYFIVQSFIRVSIKMTTACMDNGSSVLESCFSKRKKKITRTLHISDSIYMHIIYK